MIEDKPPEIEQVIKKVKKNIFNISLGNRNSRSSVKSDNSMREKDPPIKTESTHPQPAPVSLPQQPSVDHNHSHHQNSNHSSAISEPKPQQHH